VYGKASETTTITIKQAKSKHRFFFYETVKQHKNG